jgi:hypothetical protein
MTEKVQGPASYFPSIEKTNGQPMQHRFAVIGPLLGRAHKRIVGHLKSERGLGRGHANAIVAHQLARMKGA